MILLCIVIAFIDGLIISISYHSGPGLSGDQVKDFFIIYSIMLTAVVLEFGVKDKY